MNILFDAGIMNGSFVGIAKSTWYLYDNCHRLCEDFHAYGFNTPYEDKDYFACQLRKQWYLARTRFGLKQN